MSQNNRSNNCDDEIPNNSIFFFREGSEDLKKPAGVFRFPKMEFIMIQDESQNFEGRLFQLAERNFDRS